MRKIYMRIWYISDFIGLAKSQPVQPESKSSTRRNCTSRLFIPTPASCKTSLVECPFRCREEWPSPAPCSSSTGNFAEYVNHSTEEWDFLPCNYCTNYCTNTSLSRILWFNLGRRKRWFSGSGSISPLTRSLITQTEMQTALWPPPNWV